MLHEKHFGRQKIRFLSSTRPSITIDIKANDSDGPLAISQREVLALTLKLDSSGNTSNADYRIVAYCPSGVWYYYKISAGFQQGLTVTYQGPLLFLNDYKGIFLSGLSAGTHTFYFAVDLDMNGVINTGANLLFYDSVTVTVR